MSDPNTPFDHRPDLVLGAALRAALAPPPGDTGAFVARVLAAADRPADPLAEVLARWARRGIAAALLAALASGWVVGRGLAAPDDPPVGDTQAVIAGVQEPDAGVLLASFADR